MSSSGDRPPCWKAHLGACRLRFPAVQNPTVKPSRRAPVLDSQTGLVYLTDVDAGEKLPKKEVL
jgi:hypothetical protein